MNSIALYDKIENPTLLQNLQALGKEFSTSGILGINNPAQGVVLAMTCMAENITPIEFARTYHVVEGRLSMKADAMQAKFQESGGRIEWIQSDVDVCEAKFIHPDYAPNGVMLKVTKKEFVDSGKIIAKNGELKDNWRHHPRQMLRARIISEGVRMVNPSIVAGYYTPEEISDFDDGERQSTRKKPLFENAKKNAAEPKETEARVVDDLNPETIAKLQENEEAINAYLEKVKYIAAGQTWRDLSQSKKAHVNERIDSLIKKATELVSKETANV